MRTIESLRNSERERERRERRERERERERERQRAREGTIKTTPLLTK